jgi:hypothetical protein
MRAVREALLQFGSGALGHLDCVDLHHGHGARLPCNAGRPAAPRHPPRR